MTSSAGDAAANNVGRRWTSRRALVQEATLAEIVPALAGHDVRTLLIKGAATARLIGVPTLDRPSVDLDLLIHESSLVSAHAVLESLGFRHLDRPHGPGQSWKHAENWTRGHPFPVWIDLHLSLPQADGAAKVFEALSRDAQTVRIGPSEVEIPGDAACALILVLHAAQHGRTNSRPLDDLDRAVAVVTEATWRGAASLAAEVGLMSSFAFGLRLVGGGAALAEQLGVRGQGTVIDRFRASGAPGAGPVWIHTLRHAPNLRSAMSVLRDGLLPSRTLVRALRPEVGSSRVRLAAFYVHRVLAIPRSVVQYVRARDRDLGR